jgi:uncharacterized protein YkwD
MARGQVPLGHTGFAARTAAISEALVVIRAGENVTTNRGYDDPVTEAIRAWSASELHDANVSDYWTHTGVGVFRSDDDAWWFTQIFIDDGQR